MERRLHRRLGQPQTLGHLSTGERLEIAEDEHALVARRQGGDRSSDAGTATSVEPTRAYECCYRIGDAAQLSMRRAE
jgi:hypothetical protein